MPDERYGSHLGVLNFVMWLVKPKRVLELGAGEYSTKAFLDFPTVEHVLTVETDEESAPEPHDKLTLRLTNDTVEALPPDLTDYDLVLIDNGAAWSGDREPVIEAVLSQDDPVTIVHDAEYKPYYYGIEEHAGERFMVFTDEVPWTAVVW